MFSSLFVRNRVVLFCGLVTERQYNPLSSSSLARAVRRSYATTESKKAWSSTLLARLMMQVAVLRVRTAMERHGGHAGFAAMVPGVLKFLAELRSISATWKLLGAWQCLSVLPTKCASLQPAITAVPSLRCPSSFSRVRS